MALFETVTDLRQGAEVLRRRRYGVIEMADGQLAAIHLRPWPKLISLGEIWLQERFFLRDDSDRCLVYYDQPFRATNFLALKYAVSSRRATFRTIHAAALVLDEIALIKRIDAVVCEVWNRRISDRLLRRWGWERHVPHSRRRHYIKRYYGSDRETRNPESLWLDGQLALPQGEERDYYPAPFAPGAESNVPSRGDSRHATHFKNA